MTLNLTINNIEEAYPKELYSKVLAHFMKEQGLTTLVYKGETPYFNDGDPCYHYTEYFTVPNYWCEYTIPYVGTDGEIGETNIEDNYISEYPEDQYIPSDISEEDYKQLSTDEFEYPIKGFKKFLFDIGEPLIGTNLYAIIRLKEDGTLDIKTFPNEDHD
jgi:hypothetical protein